jgi:hypothetical protein
VQRGHGHAGALEALGQRHRRRDLRELALAVRAAAAVVALEHDVVEVERRLAERGDVDDAGGGAAPQEWQQAQREREAREVVDREAQLVAVAALLARALVRAAGPDPRVADQHVQLVGRVGHLVGQLPDLVERGEVGAEGLAADLGEPLRVAAVAQHARAVGLEALGYGAPEAVRRAGDQDRRSHGREA